MKSIKKIIRLATLVPLLFGGAAANALAVGETQNFSWNYDTGAGFFITGFGSIKFDTFSAGSIGLIVTLNNTTINPGGLSNLVSFGFGVDPNATSVTVSGGTYMLDATMDSIPNTTGIEVCAWAGNNCNGGPVNDGIAKGLSDTFLLTLAGSWTDSITVAPIGFKYQGFPTSYEFYSSSGQTSSGNTSNGSQVPEPASSLVLLGLGLLGLGFTRRMKNAA